jgi:hypothetical protein
LTADYGLDGGAMPPPGLAVFSLKVVGAQKRCPAIR